MNPKHLFLGTHLENMRDMFAKHRNPDRAGSHGPKRKLSASQVYEIRAMKGTMSSRRIAAKFGVNCTTICKIHNGQTWRRNDTLS